MPQAHLLAWVIALGSALTPTLGLPEGWPETHTELMAKRTYFESPYPIPCATACMYIDIVWGWVIT